MLFECAICPAITMLMLIGLVGLLVVLRIQPSCGSGEGEGKK
jgi:hypothetical protein